MSEVISNFIKTVKGQRMKVRGLCVSDIIAKGTILKDGGWRVVRPIKMGLFGPYCVMEKLQ